MKKYLILLFLGISLVSFSENQQHQTKVDRLIAQLNDPYSTYVMVVAHRGDWRNYADNSIEGIRSCIEMGVDIVELDVSRTKDGHLILMHDKTVDRTTNGEGAVSDLTLEQIKALYLKNGLGRPSEIFRVPTLREVMLEVKDKVLVNLDKADAYFDQIYDLLVETGTIGQVLIKSNKPYQDLVKKHGERMTSMMFMPVVNMDKPNAEDFVCPGMGFVAHEVTSFSEEPKERISAIIDSMEGYSHLWINTLWTSLGGGHTDDKALTDPDGNWGYWIDRGATIIQTDRPELLLKYLRSRKLHD